MRHAPDALVELAPVPRVDGVAVDLTHTRSVVENHYECISGGCTNDPCALFCWFTHLECFFNFDPITGLWFLELFFSYVL